MPGALGPRFALEAGFLILLAAVLGFADLSPLLIILIMGLAWVLVSLIEYFAWRQGPRFPTRYAAATGPPLEQHDLPVQEPAAPAQAPPPPAAPPPPVASPVEEETMIESRADQPPPEAGSAEESVEQAGERVDAARLAFDEEERRTRHRLAPLQPRPRRRFGLFGRRVRPGESSREEEQ
jgi:predicted lipid-binding transport protein (Tim44 family)